MESSHLVSDDVERKLLVDAKDALLSFVQGPDGALWQKSRSGWDSSSDDVCNWTGIACNENDEVYKINLENTRLTASIPDSLGSLGSLTHLYLAGNNMFGDVPKTVQALPNLVHVDLSMNSFRGAVPTFTSPNLEVVNLSHNSLTGPIPEDFGSRMSNAVNLKVIDFKYNRISGSIPKSIELLSSKLVEFDLSSNNLNGPIPDAIGNFKSLEGLFLSNNRLSGPIPPSITRSTMSLSQIFLQGNELSGTLPASFSDLPFLKNLFIDGNKLTGAVPQELCDRNLNAIFFQEIKIEVRGGDSDFDDDAKPKEIDENYDVDVLNKEGLEDDEHDSTLVMLINGTAVPVYKSETGDGYRRGRHLMKEVYQREFALLAEITDDNQCSDDGCVRDGCNSIACPAGYESTSSGKDGVFPCRKCHHDYVNPYIGASSCFTLNQYEIMKSFYEATNGVDWVGAYDNWADETVSVCKWPGIACNNNGDIISIVLPNSNLKGAIPENLGFLRHLEIFDVSDNFLTGEIPAELHYAPLEVLDVSGNSLEGLVPPVLCEKQGVNGNGKGGMFSCEKIACPIGTYSTTGRGGGKDGECISCDIDAEYLAMKACGPAFVSQGSAPTQKKAGAIFGVILISVMTNMFLCCGFLVFRRRRKMMTEILHFKDSDDFVDPEDELPMSYITKTEPPPLDPVLRGTFVEHDTFPSTMSVSKSRNAWQGGKESQSEVWLDVPKIN